MKCDASYKNGNFKTAEKFNVILSWTKDGKILASKIVAYENKNVTVTLKHFLTVKSFTNGGDYVCESQLALKNKKDFVSEFQKVELQSKLNV